MAVSPPRLGLGQLLEQHAKVVRPAARGDVAADRRVEGDQAHGVLLVDHQVRQRGGQILGVLELAEQLPVGRRGPCRRSPSSRRRPAGSSRAGWSPAVLLDVVAVGPAEDAPVEVRMSSPGVYSRCSANSTEKPLCGLRCRPEMNPSTTPRAISSSRWIFASASGVEQLQVAGVGCRTRSSYAMPSRSASSVQPGAPGSWASSPSTGLDADPSGVADLLSARKRPAGPRPGAERARGRRARRSGRARASPPRPGCARAPSPSQAMWYVSASSRTPGWSTGRTSSAPFVDGRDDVALGLCSGSRTIVTPARLRRSGPPFMCSTSCSAGPSASKPSGTFRLPPEPKTSTFDARPWRPRLAAVVDPAVNGCLERPGRSADRPGEEAVGCLGAPAAADRLELLGEGGLVLVRAEVLLDVDLDEVQPGDGGGGPLGVCADADGEQWLLQCERGQALAAASCSAGWRSRISRSTTWSELMPAASALKVVMTRCRSTGRATRGTSSVVAW